MIKYRDQLGLSFIDVLLALMLFSILIIGLLNFHSSLLARLVQFQKNNQAEIIAFSLLDSYPAPVNIDWPCHWQYQWKIQQYSDKCKIVSVLIQPDLGHSITQERWFCRNK